jgi:hypothetical protein
LGLRRVIFIRGRPNVALNRGVGRNVPSFSGACDRIGAEPKHPAKWCEVENSSAAWRSKTAAVPVPCAKVLT